MTTVWICAVIGVVVFVGGLVGLYLQKLLPKPHIDDSRGMIGAVLGFLTLLLALVLGTIVGSSYAFYAIEKAELENISTRYIQLDLALKEYGPETKELRTRLRDSLVAAHNMFWGKGNAVDTKPEALNVMDVLPRLKVLDEYLANLNPQTQIQRQAAAAAGVNASWIQNLRLMMSLQLASPISWLLVAIVVVWSVFMFCGFGVLSSTNVTTVVALALGAFAVASAIFLILDINQPFTGLFRLPPGALVQAIDVIGQ